MSAAATQTPRERIRQRRIQMLTHFYLYYVLDDSIVDDHTWQRWADELVALQAAHPDASTFYASAFADWDGSSGFHLPRDGWVAQNALRLRALHERGPVLAAPEKTPPAPARRVPAASIAPPPVPASQPQMSLF